MKKAVKLCKLYRSLMKMLGVAFVGFLMPPFILLVIGSVSDNFAFKLGVIACLPLLAIALAIWIVRIRARRAVCREIRKIIEHHFELNKDNTKVKEIYVSENDHEYSYNVSLTRNSNIYEYDGLIMDLNYLRDNISSALAKRVQIYCNSVWVN